MSKKSDEHFQNNIHRDERDNDKNKKYLRTKENNGFDVSGSYPMYPLYTSKKDFEFPVLLPTFPA
jgi:hypothetical protein